MRKPFDVLAEGLLSENSWGDRRLTFSNDLTASELLRRPIAQTIAFTADEFHSLDSDR